MISPIYSDGSLCRGCYRCVRECPIKAIKVSGGKAIISKSRCIYCGKCVSACPVNAIRIRSDIERVKLAIHSGRKAICSIAPSFVSEFPEKDKELLAALYKLGFSGVSETAMGAKLLLDAFSMYMQKHDGKLPYISTACPSVIELAKKYYPDALERLLPLPSPLQSHSAYLRSLYGEDILIVFIGPCISKKLEADHSPGYPDFALTFKELREWMKSENIDLDDIDIENNKGFIPKKVDLAVSLDFNISKFPVEVAGIEEVSKAFSSGVPDDVFLNTFSCNGGCADGYGARHDISIAEKKKTATLYIQDRHKEKDLFVGDHDFSAYLLQNGYGALKVNKPAREDSFSTEYAPSDIKHALEELGKFTPDDETNCGGCGYPTCRDFARAYLEKMVDTDMCVTKMRRDIVLKVDMLLRTIPYGVVIVDDKLKIDDCNLLFLKLFGNMEDNQEGQSLINMAKGLPLESFVPFSDKIREQFSLKETGQYRIHFKDKVLRVTFFFIDGKKLLAAMFEDITAMTVRREAVVKKAEDVIQKSLETVQQIASLLGENAADTEIILNSLIDVFTSSTSNDGELK